MLVDAVFFYEEKWKESFFRVLLHVLLHLASRMEIAGGKVNFPGAQPKSGERIGKCRNTGKYRTREK